MTGDICEFSAQQALVTFTSALGVSRHHLVYALMPCCKLAIHLHLPPPIPLVSCPCLIELDPFCATTGLLAVSVLIVDFILTKVLAVVKCMEAQWSQRLTRNVCVAQCVPEKDHYKAILEKQYSKCAAPPGTGYDQASSLATRPRSPVRSEAKIPAIPAQEGYEMSSPAGAIPPRGP